MMNVDEIELKLKAFLNSFCNFHKRNYEKFADILLRAYDGDFRGLQPIDKELTKDLADLITTLKAIRIHTLYELESFTEKFRNDYRQVYVVDCLGLPDLYALMCNLDNIKFDFKIFINQRTNTQAFKDVFVSDTMADVARKLKAQAITELDKQLHKIVEMANNKEFTRNEILNIIVERMNYVSSLLTLHTKAKTMILTDHGYDIIRVGSRYIINHVFPPDTKPALAKLAIVVLLK